MKASSEEWQLAIYPKIIYLNVTGGAIYCDREEGVVVKVRVEKMSKLSLVVSAGCGLMDLWNRQFAVGVSGSRERTGLGI